MVVLIWVGVFLALLYFWLIGGWFARVLMCMLLMATFGAVGVVMGQKIPATIVTFGLMGAGIGWAIGSGPTWYWRERMRSIAQAENAHAMTLYR